jgi:hypothetical protein
VPRKNHRRSPGLEGVAPVVYEYNSSVEILAFF